MLKNKKCKGVGIYFYDKFLFLLNRNYIKYMFLLTMVFSIGVTGCRNSSGTIHVYGNENNDLVEILRRQGMNVVLYNNVMDVVQQAPQGEGILVLADNYPHRKVDLQSEFYDLLNEKKLKAYIEFPSELPGMKAGEIEKAKYERAVVNSGMFNGFPDSLGILGINGLHYLDVKPASAKMHIVAAKVAGFDSAIFGLPENYIPLMFEVKDSPVLIATTNLSRFVSGRYAPEKEWEAIWVSILNFVQPGLKIDRLEWEPVVGPSFSKDETLPADVQRTSVLRGVEWYKNARMLAPGSYEDTVAKMAEAKNYKLSWSPEIPVGDGTYGLYECIFSEIDENGKQPINIIKRGDCISEASMAFALAGRLFENSGYMDVAGNLMDFYLIHSMATKNEYGDPKHGAYGLIPWGITNRAWFRASYGDDNARFLLAAWVTAAITGSDHWDETMMKSLIALLRTTGTNGFRGSRINLEDFQKNGWKFYYNRDIVNPAPHFECYLWACYLWAYDKTGDELFLDKAKKGITNMMEFYPAGWRWTNGLAQERARMILPLSWLVRVEDTAENREMLFRVVNDFLELQASCGAIREELGSIEMGRYPPPQSNEAYGTTEASLIAQNGDPVSDLLYTTNFAFLGLHEAVYATGDEKIRQATDKLAEFLCRIQVKSEGHPELDGGWMRAFDYERFEHWGSNADHGWGAWAIETGWTQGWIASILALRELDTSIWDLTKDSNIARHHPELRKELLPYNLN